MAGAIFVFVGEALAARKDVLQLYKSDERIV